MTTREEAHKVIDAVFDNERRPVIVLVAPPGWSPEHAGHWRDVVQAALDEDRGMMLLDGDGITGDERAKPSPFDIADAIGPGPESPWRPQTEPKR